MPVFASNWSSLMSISSNKSSQARKAFAPSKGCGNIWGGVSTRVCGACDARRERMGRVRSARCNIFYSLAGERFSGVRRMRRRQHLGWTFRLGTRWASEGARRRAGTHPRAAGPRASAAPEAKGGAELFCLGVCASSSRLVASKQRARCERCGGKFQQNDDFSIRVSAVSLLFTEEVWISGSLSAVMKNSRAEGLRN